MGFDLPIVHEGIDRDVAQDETVYTTWCHDRSSRHCVYNFGYGDSVGFILYGSSCAQPLDSDGWSASRWAGVPGNYYVAIVGFNQAWRPFAVTVIGDVNTVCSPKEVSVTINFIGVDIGITASDIGKGYNGVTS